MGRTRTAVHNAAGVHGAGEVGTALPIVVASAGSAPGEVLTPP
jgi:hypothetical protein